MPHVYNPVPKTLEFTYNGRLFVLAPGKVSEVTSPWPTISDEDLLAACLHQTARFGVVKHKPSVAPVAPTPEPQAAEPPQRELRKKRPAPEPKRRIARKIGAVKK